MYNPLKLEDTLNFGKHKGKKIIDVLKYDAQYLKFLVNKEFNFEEKTRHKIMCTVTYSNSKHKIKNFKQENSFEYEDDFQDDEDFTDEGNFVDFYNNFM